MQTYELHTFTNGQWIFNSVYEDSESAKAEARRLKKTSKHAAFSVTEEIFDEASSTASSQTIFTTGDTSARNRAGPTQAREGPSRAGQAAAVRRRRYGGRNARLGIKAPGIVLPIFALVSLLIAGAGALYALQLMI